MPARKAATLWLELKEAATGSAAPGRDCPPPPSGRVGSDAACASLQVHSGRAGGTPDRWRRGPPARAMCPVRGLAARAGVCRRMVQAALREAARLGLLTIEERRREGRRNLPNVVRIVAKDWTTWLTRGGRSPPGRPSR